MRSERGSIAGRMVHTDHWADAEREGKHAALAMLGSVEEYNEVPFFSSEMFDCTLKSSGWELSLHRQGFWNPHPHQRVSPGKKYRVSCLTESIQVFRFSKVYDNPVCGDSLKLAVSVKNGNIEKILHESHGCAISVASTSIMSEYLTGKPVEEAREMIDVFIAALRGEESSDVLEEIGDAVCFHGVVRYPVRVKCATLAWHAARDSLCR